MFTWNLEVLVFAEERKPENLENNTFGASPKTNNKLNQHRPHWWDGSALLTVPSPAALNIKYCGIKEIIIIVVTEFKYSGMCVDHSPIICSIYYNLSHNTILFP